MKKNKTEKGITLVALIITIIILLILVGVSVNILTGANGIINRAIEARIYTVLGALKEEINLERISSRIANNTDFIVEELFKQGKVKRVVVKKDDEYYLSYVLNSDSWHSTGSLGRGDSTSGKDIFIIDPNFNIKYIARDGKEYGDEVNNTLLEDETDIRFVSEAFSQYVSLISGLPEGKLKFKWMKNQTSLSITDPSIDSLEDLVFFPNLTSISIGSWDSKSRNIVNKDFSWVKYCEKLTTITSIYAAHLSFDGLEYAKNLTSISVTSPTNLAEDFSALAQLSKLKTIKFSGDKVNYSNLIEAIKNLSNLNTLTIVGLKNNVDMKKLSKLKSDVVSLDLQSCGITEINGIEGFKNLKTINLSDNNITDITPLAKNTNLTTINLTKNVNIDENKENYTGDRLIALNKLAEIINNGGTINLDVDKLKLFNNYTSLDLSSQKLENLDALQGITGLTSLTLYNNKLTLQSESDQAILSQMKNLKTISLRRNANLANISFVNSLDNLTSLNIFECPLIKLKSIENKVSSLQMQLSNETLLSIFECDKSKITSLNLNTSGMSLSVEFPDLSDFTQLTYLKMSSQLSIPSFENISKISSLETLSLTNCSLHNRMISFNKLQNLKTLDLQNNSLWTEDLENLKALKNNTNISIDLRNNSIIDASALLELNQPAKIDLRNNVNLTQESKDALTAKFGNKVLY